MKDLRWRHAEQGSTARLEAPHLTWPVFAIPEPAGPAGSCVLSKRDGADWVWATLACDRANPYVCKKEPVLVHPTTRHAYLTLFAELSWQDAATACQNRGAHLVTIADAAEQDFVARLAPGQFWIGARDDALDGSFTWSTGEPAVYTAFAAGEPDHDAGAQCLLMGIDEGWHDRPCADGNAYVCEIEP